MAEDIEENGAQGGEVQEPEGQGAPEQPQDNQSTESAEIARLRAEFESLKAQRNAEGKKYRDQIRELKGEREQGQIERGEFDQALSGYREKVAGLESDLETSRAKAERWDAHLERVESRNVEAMKGLSEPQRRIIEKIADPLDRAEAIADMQAMKPKPTDRVGPGGDPSTGNAPAFSDLSLTQQAEIARSSLPGAAEKKGPFGR